ncbi:uncharacterized protein [Paramormyrops kingsleyae]|uniref:uncharacterized protein isoform X1 n=2 Tax=Paramormyrops kingsleyae TaxID=1676925 RepID=UPI003B9706DC
MQTVQLASETVAVWKQENLDFLLIPDNKFYCHSRENDTVSWGTMEHSLALHLAIVSLVLLNECGGTTPFPINMSSEGSGETGSEGLTTTVYSAPSPVYVSPTDELSSGTRMEQSVLSQVAGFLQDHLLLIVTSASLLVTVVFLLCCAAVVSRKRKTSSYYPSSFPAQKYVDERDSIGGSRTFSEVPDRQPDSQGAEPVDSARQLQVDIMKAAKNLRSPSRSPVSEVMGKVTEALLPEVKGLPEESATEMVEKEAHIMAPVDGTSDLQNEESCQREAQECMFDVKKDEVLKEDTFGQEAEQDEAPCAPQLPGVHQEVSSGDVKEAVLPESQMVMEETAVI